MSQSENDASKKIKDMLNAVGALAEMTKMQYDALIKAGFDEQKAIYSALELTKFMMSLTMQKNSDD